MPVSKKLIRQCKNNNKDAQREIYEKYSPVIFGICVRYVRDKSTAEDIMQECFITIFSKVSQFKGLGSFEGWMKRIAVNTSLMHIRKNKKEYSYDNLEYISNTKKYETSEEKEIYKKNIKSVITNAEFSKSEILEYVTQLPTGFRTVFNLYAIEKYKHKEIAKKLSISVGTSKSQLLRARKKLQKILYKAGLQKIKNSEKRKFLILIDER